MHWSNIIMDTQSACKFQFKKEIEEICEPMIYVPEGRTHIRLEGMDT